MAVEKNESYRLIFYYLMNEFLKSIVRIVSPRLNLIESLSEISSFDNVYLVSKLNEGQLEGAS